MMMNQQNEDPVSYVSVNGEERQVPGGTTIADLVLLLALAPERLAIERNLEVVPRIEWDKTYLADGDRIEIVHFVGGGAI